MSIAQVIFLLQHGHTDRHTQSHRFHRSPYPHISYGIIIGVANKQQY